LAAMLVESYRKTRSNQRVYATCSLAWAPTWWRHSYLCHEYDNRREQHDKDVVEGTDELYRVWDRMAVDQLLDIGVAECV